METMNNTSIVIILKSILENLTLRLNVANVWYCHLLFFLLNYEISFLSSGSRGAAPSPNPTNTLRLLFNIR